MKPIKEYPGIDYDKKPKSYWRDPGPLAAVLRNVKGRKRRELIRSYFEQGRLEELEEEVLQDGLSVSQRDQLGQLHPILMGGEYLPDCGRNEVEVARIELNSTTADVVTFRARPRKGRVIWRIVDEYKTEFLQARKSSKRVLSLRELVKFIDGSSEPEASDEWSIDGMGLLYNNMNADTGSLSREQLRDFTRISSEFYPQLFDHYEHVFDDWVAVPAPVRSKRARARKHS